MRTEYKLATGEVTEYADAPVTIIQKTLAQLAEENNAPIKAQLDIIDFKSIRALREGDAVRLNALDDQAKAFRLQLK